MTITPKYTGIEGSVELAERALENLLRISKFSEWTGEHLRLRKCCLDILEKFLPEPTDGEHE